MVTNGVLPIDQITDFYSPMKILVDNIPKKVFESVYKITIDYPKQMMDHYQTLLNAYAVQRK